MLFTERFTKSLSTGVGIAFVVVGFAVASTMLFHYVCFRGLLLLSLQDAGIVAAPAFVMGTLFTWRCLDSRWPGRVEFVWLSFSLALLGAMIHRILFVSLQTPGGMFATVQRYGLSLLLPLEDRPTLFWIDSTWLADYSWLPVSVVLSTLLYGKLSCLRKRYHPEETASP